MIESHHINNVTRQVPEHERRERCEMHQVQQHMFVFFVVDWFVRALQKDASLDEALVMSEKQFESQVVRVGGSELCNVCCFSFMVPRLQSQQRLTVARLRH